jgi:DNA-binding NtrC family response regulator
LVEDEPSVRSVAQRILASAGYRVLTAASAEQALAISNEHAGPIDLLVSDVVMAGVDGPALAAELSRLRSDLRLLFVSGYSHEHGLLPDKPSAGAGFLPKPFTYDSLLAKVAELLAAPRDDGSRKPSTARRA